ncbi:hypothetical protein BJ912DRAFT_936174 [Pholiota molesta]|nr:hypothetical protein BJ912DRAFT_936174 [Pholiota molesta]
MVFGLIKHIYQYFVPEALGENPSPTALMNPPLKTPDSLTKAYISIYDEHGRIEGYVATARQPNITRIESAPMYPTPPAGAPVLPLPDSETLYTRTADGHFVPVAPQMRPSTSLATVKSVPTPSTPPTLSVSAIHMANPSMKVLDANPTVQIEWDGWPDGEFHRDLTWEEYKATDELKIHWANRAGGTEPGEDLGASSWAQGKRTTRHCLSVIVCDNPNCSIVIHPKVEPHAVYKQLQQPCVCTAKLHEQKCGVRIYTYKWANGVHLYHSGTHAHHRPGRVLHLLSHERERFTELVKAHPNTGPLGLIVGVPGLTGPGQSAADISDAFLNIDRVSKEQQKIKCNAESGGDRFIEEFVKFMDEYPGFVIYSTLGTVTVFSVQTNFMRSILVKDTKLDDSINGTVNDAAHGWWKERNSLLMITSAYSPALLRWVPGVLSFTNSASKDHFKYHFIAVFSSIAREAEARKIELDKSMFAGMMDFSEAERAGFILAYIEFWIMQPDDKRTVEELQEEAESLLKKCQEHYRAGITRISCIGGVINPEDTEAFKARAMGLLDMPNSDEFIIQASYLVRIDELEILCFYAACGRDHSLMEGLRSLHAVAVYYERLFHADSKGIPIWYGAAETWKATAANIGRTKKSCSSHLEDKKRSKNDGRPPDTKDELLPPEKSKKRRHRAPKVTNSLITFGPPSYPWDANSCWLDTSLELLFFATMRNFDEFTSLFDSVPKTTGLYAFFTTLNSRRLLENNDDDTTQALRKQRNDLRMVLHQERAIDNVDSNQSLSAWLWYLLRQETSRCQSSLVLQYFHTWLFDLHSCDGSVAIGGAHYEIVQPCQHQEHVLHPYVHQVFKGSVTSYFDSLLSLDRDPTDAPSCWRVKDGQPLCPGHRVDLKNIIISLPIILTLEVELDTQNSLSWDFPAALYPATKTLATKNGLVYDLIGLVLFSKTASHFIARYASIDKKTIYTYDGLAHNGIPIIERNTTFATHLSGQNIEIPNGYSIYEAFYYLRGGFKAQKLFYEKRTNDLTKCLSLRVLPTSSGPTSLPSIVFQAEHLSKLDQHRRKAWTSKPDSWAVEYVSNKPPKTDSWKLSVSAESSPSDSQHESESWAEDVSSAESLLPDSQHAPESLAVEDVSSGELGKWLHSWNVKTPEDVLADPSTIPYTQQISDTLLPSVDILKRLLKAPDTVDSETVPAKAWMDKSKMDVKKELVPFVGGLSLTKRAQISNWFEAHVSKNKNLRHKWLGRLPIAHAHTLYILKSVKADPKNKGLTQNMLLEKAWDVQFSGTPSALIDTDVDKECLEILEEEMFEKSARAGIAGHYQWGLDAGDHHYWDPYAGTFIWDLGDKKGNEDELECGPEYQELPKLPQVVDLCPRPQPCPKGKAKKAIK